MSNLHSMKNPFKGLFSYTENDSDSFFGRDSEVEDLLEFVETSYFFTLYGQTGIGKTSLLQAGLAPVLRKSNYLPLFIRLSLCPENQSFSEFIVERLKEECIKYNISIETNNSDNVYDNELSPLWNWFQQNTLKNCFGSLITPVIIFDQFEEIFVPQRTTGIYESLHDAHLLCRQIHMLVDDRFPGRRGNCRFIASIREDFLFRFEDVIDRYKLIDLKECRYRLKFLSPEEACNILNYTGGDYLFEPENKTAIIYNIVNQCKDIEQNGTISTLMLSLLASVLCEKVIDQGYAYITLDLVQSLSDSILLDYYKNATKSISKKTIEYIETRFVSQGGFRKPISEEDCKKDAPEVIPLIKDNKTDIKNNTNFLFQYVSYGSQNNTLRNVELIHDKLARTIADYRDRKQIDKNENKKRVGKLFWVLSLISLFFFVFFLLLAWNIVSLTDDVTVVNEYEAYSPKSSFFRSYSPKVPGGKLELKKGASLDGHSITLLSGLSHLILKDSTSVYYNSLYGIRELQILEVDGVDVNLSSAFNDILIDTLLIRPNSSLCETLYNSLKNCNIRTIINESSDSAYWADKLPLSSMERVTNIKRSLYVRCSDLPIVDTYSYYMPSNIDAINEDSLKFSSSITGNILNKSFIRDKNAVYALRDGSVFYSQNARCVSLFSWKLGSLEFGSNTQEVFIFQPILVESIKVGDPLHCVVYVPYGFKQYCDSVQAFQNVHVEELGLLSTYFHRLGFMCKILLSQWGALYYNCTFFILLLLFLIYLFIISKRWVTLYLLTLILSGCLQLLYVEYQVIIGADRLNFLKIEDGFGVLFLVVLFIYFIYKKDENLINSRGRKYRLCILLYSSKIDVELNAKIYNNLLTCGYSPEDIMISRYCANINTPYILSKTRSIIMVVDPNFEDSVRLSLDYKLAKKSKCLIAFLSTSSKREALKKHTLLNCVLRRDYSLSTLFTYQIVFPNQRFFPFYPKIDSIHLLYDKKTIGKTLEFLVNKESQYSIPSFIKYFTGIVYVLYLFLLSIFFIISICVIFNVI